jgi:hypothetical protein
MPSKRSRAPSGKKRNVRPRLSSQILTPPSPTADSHLISNAALDPDTDPEGDILASDNMDPFYGPALPGQVRNREQGVLSKLPPQSDVVDFFTKLINDNSISPEEALVKLITTYEVPIQALNRIASTVYPVPLIAPLCYLLDYILLTSSMMIHRGEVTSIIQHSKIPRYRFLCLARPNSKRR